MIHMTPESEINGWRGIGARLLDLLYPPRCGLCETVLSGGRSLCSACANDLPRLREPFCESCGEVFPGRIDRSFSCPNCSDLQFAFDFARPAMMRDERALALIHRLKYRKEIHLAADLGRLAADAFTEDARLAPAIAGSWSLVPVPLHRSRLRKRHFNQAEEISRGLARAVGLPVVHALRRTRNTATQTLLSRKQRMDNLRGAFQITRAGKRLQSRCPAGVVLVDDVLTTGSTVHECARVLRQNGFQSVFVVTVMRG
jgi:competence protein ComFC